jgi:hypothetical protein
VRLADEQAFCSSPELSRLDNLVVRGYYGDSASPASAMRAKTMPQEPKRKKVKMNLTPAHVSSTLSMATRNLISVVAVTAVSGAVLLGFLAARHF